MRPIARVPTSSTLYRITAPHFCAGLVVDTSGRVTLAAPILGWTRGKRWLDLHAYFARRVWLVEEVPFCP